MTLVSVRSDGPHWSGPPPALLLAETQTADELARLVSRCLADGVSALLFASSQVPPEVAAAAEARPRLVRILSRGEGESAADELERAARATEALVRARLYRELRQEWQRRASHCREALTALDAVLSPEAPERPPRAPLATVLWAHVREVSGFGWPGPTKVALDLKVQPETMRRLRRDVPDALRAALATDEPHGDVRTQGVDDVRRGLQQAEARVRELEDDLRALQLGGLGDPSVTLNRLETAAMREALHRCDGNSRAAARRLGVNRDRFTERRQPAAVR